MRRYETDYSPLRDQLPALAKEGLTISAAARRLGMETQTVSYWSKHDGVKMAESMRRRKLTDDQVRYVREMQGILSLQKLAGEVGISAAGVARVQARKTYFDVAPCPA